MDLFRKNTTPCVVTFTAIAQEYAVTKAVYFAYLLEKGEDGFDEAADIANTCYDGEGQSIPPQDIVSVDQLG